MPTAVAGTGLSRVPGVLDVFNKELHGVCAAGGIVTALTTDASPRDRMAYSLVVPSWNDHTTHKVVFGILRFNRLDPVNDVTSLGILNAAFSLGCFLCRSGGCKTIRAIVDQRLVKRFVRLIPAVLIGGRRACCVRLLLCLLVVMTLTEIPQSRSPKFPS